MPRRLSLPAVSRLVGLATDALKSIEPRSEQRKIVDAYLHAVRRATFLAGKSKMNKRRGWSNIADRQKTRSETFQDQAAALLPMVELIVSGCQAPKVADVMSALYETPADTRSRKEEEAATMRRVSGIFADDEREDIDG